MIGPTPRLAVLVGAVLVATLTLPAPADPAANTGTVGRKVGAVPVLAGPPAQVTNELGYAAFPSVVRAPDGAALVAYRRGTGHATQDGYTVVRRSTDGKAWSDPITAAPNPGGGYATGPAGMAVDNNGRIWLALIRYLGSNTGAATNFSAWTTFSDDNGATWSTPTQVPDIVAGFTYPSGLTVLADGTLLMSLYVKTGTNWTARVLRRNDGAWVAQGSLAIVGRDATEPQLVQLADGRLMMLVRSDAPSPFYSYCYRAFSSDGGATWSAPTQIITHATGMMTPFRRPDGTIAVTYRGLVSPPPSFAFPIRMAMLDPNGVPYRSGIDPAPGDFRRFLYGGIAGGVDGGPDLLCWSAESPDGQFGSYAEVQCAPLAWPTY